MAERIPQSVAKLVVFRAYDSADHVTPKTGATIAITISKNGGAFGNPAAGATNATEISSGFYKFTLGTGDCDTLGPLAWRGAVTGIDDAGDVYSVASAFNAGFSGVPDAAADAAGGLPISDAGGLDLDAQIGTDIDAILTDTAVIGDAGAGLTEAGGTGDQFTAIPWNADWDAQVESEVNDALVALKLDHLVAVADADDVADNSIIAKMVSKGATADWSGFVNTTDSLEAIRDRGDAAWVTATGFATATNVTDAQTAIIAQGDSAWATATGFSTLDAAGVRTAVGLSTANLDTQLAALPTASENATSVLTTQMTEAYAANGAAPTLAQAAFAIHQMLMQFSISGTTITVKKLDNSTTAFAVTLDDATNPTSAERV